MEIANQNDGMYIPDISVLSDILGEEDLNKILNQKHPEEDYREVARRALLKSQMETESLVKAGMIKSDITRVDETKLDPNVLFKLQQNVTFESLKPDFDLDMFDDFNNF